MGNLEEEFFDCYARTLPYLIDKASVYIRLRGSSLLNEMGADITLEQFITLDAISSGQNFCQRDLSKILLKDRSNVTRILNILENKGLIVRTSANKGKRIIKTPKLTHKGEEYMQKYSERMKMDLNAFIEQFDKKEISILEKSLKEIISKISVDTNIQI